jgi:4'-phosphopantetheinyl transferase EntD
VIGGILPAGVVTAEAYGDVDGAEGAARLFPEEEALLARAVGKRRREFTTGRACARRALAGLGVAPVAILPGTYGAPRWPTGVVGSITHCAGYRAAAVAWAREVRALGIDAEPHEPLPRGVLGAVALPGEADSVARLGAVRPDVHGDRLLFSAKEAVFKAWSPLTGRSLGYDGGEVALDAGGTFTARIVAAPPAAGMPVTFAGRWVVEGGLVATTVAVAARSCWPGHGLSGV